MIRKIFKKLKIAPGYINRHILSPRILNMKYRDILAKNKGLEGKYSGKRCFILGSGPSIKEINIKKLQNEYIFAVNTFYQHPDFHFLKFQNYLLIDSGLPSEFSFSLVKSLSETLDKEANVFFSIKDMEEIEKTGLFSDKHKFYLVTQGIISEYFDFNIDLDRVLPWPKNSVLMCMMIAVYMGFKKVYLLGCEHNFLSFNVGRGGTINYPRFHPDKIGHIDTSDLEIAKKYKGNNH